MRPYVLLLVFSAAAAAQVTEGDVVNAKTGAPVAGAYVSAGAAMGGEPVTKTDVAGHFRLPGTSAAYAPLQVVHAGFLRSDRPIRNKTGQAASTVRIELTPAAVISGKILDEDGLPVEATVWAVRSRTVDGERKFEPVATAQSDDLGQYRLANLKAGRYWVHTGSGGAGFWDRRYVARYYPGTLRPDDSGQIEVEAGQERDGVDIRLTKYEGVTVSGHVEMPATIAATRRLLPIYLEPDPSNLETFYSPQRPDGSFVIRHVPPGDYILRADFGNGAPKAGDLLAEQRLRVGDADERDIVLKPHELRAADLAGTLLMQGGGSPSPMRIQLRARNGSGPSTRSNEDGTFVLPGILPGHYEIQVVPDMKIVNGAIDLSSMAGASYPISVQLGEKEVLETGFDLDGPVAGPLRVTVGSFIGIEGKLLDASGEPVIGAALLAIASGAAASMGGVAITEANGTFRLMLRKPGDYHIYMADDQTDWEDPDNLKKHEGDFPLLRVADGANPPVSLRLTALQAR